MRKYKHKVEQQKAKSTFVPEKGKRDVAVFKIELLSKLESLLLSALEEQIKEDNNG